ncbi:MAG TPA: FAD-dependent oxidoreductase [Candidatus Limnocylindrales bacterium]|nr:FAD-dependent oxidoreductase [Candidatus Limnocylindrales bacterium]
MPRWDRAVVLGGGIAGLLAAYVLAERYATVTVVERDRLPVAAGHRRGVPHGRHVHGLLPGGLRVLEDLLPGICQQMISGGALTGDILGDVRWYVRGQRLPQTSIGITALSASRPLIEAAIRQRVRALSNVTVRDGCMATGLLLSPDRRRVGGVQVGWNTEVLPADLVVDATGRGTRTLGWLGRHGYPDPPADRIHIDLRYVSCTFTAPPEIIGTDLLVAIGRVPGQRRSGVMQRIEGDRVLVTLAGIRGDRPPLDPHGFAGYAASLPAHDIADLIRAGTPVSALTQFHCPTYVRQRFEQVARFPAGLLLMGDSVCSLNPMYAEGISVAARTAAVLRHQLRGADELTAEPFFKAVCSTLDAPWGWSADADAADPSPSLTSGYLAEVEKAAPHDLALATAYVRVAALIDPPATLLSPAIRQRVAAIGCRPRADGPHATPARSRQNG